MNNIYLTFELLLYFDLIVEEYLIDYSSIKEQAFTINFLNNEVSSMNDILFKSMVKIGIIEILEKTNFTFAVPMRKSSVENTF